MNMNLRGWAKVGGLGALGLVVAAVLAALSLQLVSQPVGLSSEPLTAGNLLAPPALKTDAGSTSPTSKTTKKRTPSPTPAATDTKTRTGVPPSLGNDDDSSHDNGGAHHEDD